jgi:hypothetical protein
MPHLDKSHEKYKKYIYSYLYDLEYMKRFEKSHYDILKLMEYIKHPTVFLIRTSNNLNFLFRSMVQILK